MRDTSVFSQMQGLSSCNSGIVILMVANPFALQIVRVRLPPEEILHLHNNSGYLPELNRFLFASASCRLLKILQNCGGTLT
jgi:hypothetical protein